MFAQCIYVYLTDLAELLIISYMLTRSLPDVITTEVDTYAHEQINKISIFICAQSARPSQKSTRGVIKAFDY